jgi:hypothetical protein
MPGIIPFTSLEVAMESLFGMPYLKNGDTTLRVLHRYQDDVRNAINTGRPAAPERLTGECIWLKRLAQMVEGLKFRRFFQPVVSY